MKFPTNKQLSRAKSNYDSMCHCGHTSGEDPSYHFQSGVNYLKSFQVPEVILPKDVELTKFYYIKPFLNSEFEIAQALEFNDIRYFFCIGVQSVRKFEINKVSLIKELIYVSL